MKKNILPLLPALCLMPALSSSASPASPLPNILVILTDDLGYGDLSCQGAKDLRTPNIDKIFQQGVTFKNFYANSTVCSPTRASLMTGCYPDLSGVPGVIRTNPDDSWGFLRTDLTLLPGYLKKAGYHTALIGKWHLGLEAPNLPNLRGFDLFHGFLGDMMDDYYTHLRHGNNYMRLNDKVVNPDGHATEVFSQWAVEFLKQREEQKNPFFLFLAYNAPHDPIQPPAEWVAGITAREKGITPKRAKLAALIEHLDSNIGRVLKQLEQSGFLENTLIIFTSDNGGVVNYEANNGPWRGGKQDMYEGGIRVAAAFLWKNHITQGSVTSANAMTMDILPTLCEVAGIQVEPPVDGISLLPVLTGRRDTTGNRTMFFVRREGNLRYGGMAYYAARKGNFKIVQNTPWEPQSFYNMILDPGETAPLNKIGNKEYESLFKSLMKHIRLAGAIPWQSRQSIMKETKQN